MVLYKESCRERIIMKRKIGEIFELHNEWYQCIEGRCKDCYFSEKRFLCKQFITKNFCTSGIIFQKLEKVGEPIIVNGKNVQLLKTTIANCDNCAFYKDVNCDFTCYPRKCYGGEEGTYVEIKTKEDMEETNFIEKLETLCKRYNMPDGVRTDFISEVKEIIKDKEECNFKPFNLKAAKAGKPVCTRDGRKARIICFDVKDTQPIIGLYEKNIDGIVREYLCSYHTDGRMYDDQNTGYDLMMSPEKKEGWVNVYKKSIYKTKEDAFNRRDKENYLMTIKVGWEE